MIKWFQTIYLVWREVMKKFMDRDFLLDSDVAVKLYYDVASKLPIIDCHCHLSPREIAENKKFSNITELWLYADHYKWRAMRSCGVDEKYITGDGSDFEKFRELCRIMPHLIGNPVYHWSHLELQRYFDCDLTINSANCEAIWKHTSEKLARDRLGAQDYIKNSNVVLLCTTDDPTDDLRYHKEISESGFDVKVLPAFCPDRGFDIKRRGFVDYIKNLGDITGVSITDLDSLCRAYTVSLDRFASLGCKTADHGLAGYDSYVKPDPYHANEIFKKALASDGRDVSESELALWKTQMMRFFGLEYVKRGWVLQLHYGEHSDYRKKVFDNSRADLCHNRIYAKNCVVEAVALLNYLQCNNALPRMIIYPTNPSDSEAAITLCESFCRGDGSMMPTIVRGNNWWINDNVEGIVSQIRLMGNVPAFGCLLGVSTDAESFISYSRHEYFRRILCNIIGEWVEKGLYPNDFDTLSALVSRISYENSKNYFKFEI